MASYTPVNVYVFVQAFTGAVAGLLGQSNQLAPNPQPARGYYDDTLDVAGAWAQEVDIQWGVTFPGEDPDLYSFGEVLAFSEQLFAVYNPQPDNGTTTAGSSTDPATYTATAKALMEILQDGETYLAGLGIVVPGFGGDCCLTPIEVKGNTTTNLLPGQETWCIDAVEGELWIFNFPAITAAVPDNAEIEIVDGTQGGGFNASQYAWVNNPNTNIEDPGAQPTTTNNPILVQNPGETARWQLDPTRTFWKVK